MKPNTIVLSICGVCLGVVTQAAIPECSPTPSIAPTPTCTPHVNSNCPPPPSVETQSSPFPTPIPHQFQPPQGDILKWRVFQPTDGATQWPVVLIIHGGDFNLGGYYGNDVEIVAQDLADRGYYALIVNYRLAPCGYIVGQESHDDPLSGRPLEQTNDVKALVRAARADGHCLNKLVAVIGGSAGGTHGMSVALDHATSVGWPNWQATDRVNLAVGLSGAYDLSDRDDPVYESIDRFVRIVENYTNTCVRVDAGAPNDQKRWSPVTLVTSDAPPIYLINTQEDRMPWHQIVDMQCALINAGVTNYNIWTIPNSNEHSFGYWRSPICDTYPCDPSIKVRDRVIAFLDQYLKTP